MSLKASIIGIEKAKKALLFQGITQGILAERIGIGRDSCSKFFNNKPISRTNFEDICNSLGLDWTEIFEKPPSSSCGKSSESHEHYIHRPPIEENCFSEIQKEGALLRIKASQKMGKTLLLEKVLDSGNLHNCECRTVKIDFQLTDPNVLIDLKTFLRWFCVNVAGGLNLEDNLDEYWRDIYGLNQNCIRYFQKYLLSVSDSPLVLALDNFELLFAEKEIFENFCRLLRGFHESAKQGNRVGQLWKKMRLIVVYSTDDYPKLDTNHSPFNVGLLIELPEFTQQQVAKLARLNKLQLDPQAVNSLMKLIGGNPFLVTLAFDCLKNKSLSLEELLKAAPTNGGIYSNHLRELLWILQKNPQLKLAFKQVANSKSPILLDTERGFKLKSMGLVKSSGDDSYLTNCDLYRQYFSVHLKDT